MSLVTGLIAIIVVTYVSLLHMFALLEVFIMLIIIT